MDTLARQILRELLPAEPEVAPPTSKQIHGRDAQDHWSHAVLLERGAYLRKLAAFGEGSASETLKEYPQHSIMLSVRLRSGIAEQHEHFADLFFVLEGRATLATGGTVVNAKTIAPGEMRGDSIAGGSRQPLRAGDVAHVPAGLAHQMLIEGDKPLTCMVIKIRQNE